MQQPRLSVFRINQEGYAAGLSVRIAFTGEGPLCLKDSGGQVLCRLALDTAPVDPASGDRVALVDFERLPQGTYTLEGAGESRSFTVSRWPWQAVANTLIKGLYFQPCCCASTGRWVRSGSSTACRRPPWPSPGSCGIRPACRPSPAP